MVYGSIILEKVEDRPLSLVDKTGQAAPRDEENNGTPLWESTDQHLPANVVFPTTVGKFSLERSQTKKVTVCKERKPTITKELQLG